MKRTGGRTCTNKTIPEPTLKDLCAEVLGTDGFDSDVFESAVLQVVMPEPNRAVFHLSDGTTVDREWHSQQRLRAWNPDRRAAWGEYQRAHWDQSRREETAERMRKRATPERRESHSKILKQWWADPANAKRMAASRKSRGGGA